MYKFRPLKLKNVKINGTFWEQYNRLIKEKVIAYQWDALNDNIPDAPRSHCIKNFEIAAGKSNEAYYGMVFQDSDLYKWLECVAYSLETDPDPKWEAIADGVISLIGKAQQPDGYINTYYTVKEPGKRWNNLQEGHELYCAGHMIEAAVAYHDATGKREFLDIAVKFADCIDNTFGTDEGKIKGYPGHQEIELALYRLYKTTGESRYIDLAYYFIKQRGTGTNYFITESGKPEFSRIWQSVSHFSGEYSQSHIPPAEQREAVGHAVRAMYMYSAMADLASEKDDEALKEACLALFDNVANTQMYITGAVGSTSIGEAFTVAYDLPNDLVYAETCASVGLMMFGRRMNALTGDAQYADVMERALYNTVLAGMSISGTEFYYVNPLESEPYKVENNPVFKHIQPVRRKWFDCACCPSNLARTVTGLGAYAYGASKDGLYVNLYCQGSAKDGNYKIEAETSYPFGDNAQLKVSGGSFKLYLRNPEAAPVISVTVNGKPADTKTENGYIILENDWQGDTVCINFDMTPKFMYCSNRVQSNAFKAALVRGPIVYCAEEADNGPLLGSRVINTDAPVSVVPSPEGLLPDTIALKVPAYNYKYAGNGLYTDNKPVLEPAELTFVPYFQWANRGVNEMRVYIQTLPGA